MPCFVCLFDSVMLLAIDDVGIAARDTPLSGNIPYAAVATAYYICLQLHLNLESWKFPSLDSFLSIVLLLALQGVTERESGIIEHIISMFSCLVSLYGPPSAIRNPQFSSFRIKTREQNSGLIARICLLKLCPMDEFLPGPEKFRYSYKLNMEEERCSRRASYVSRRRG